MFYLKFCINILKAKFARLFSFVMVTMLMLFSFAYKAPIQKYFDQKFKLKEQEIYFNALVKSSVPTKSLTVKLYNLPGVIKVSAVNSDQLQSKLKDTLAGVEVALPDDIVTTDYKVLKISLASDVSSKSLALIKEYLVRVIGKDSLTLSSLKRKSGIDKKNSYLVGFLKRISTIICLFLSIIWFALFFAISAALENEVYLVEKFQRKVNVKLKVFLFFELMALVPILILTALDFSIQFSNILLAFLPIAVMHLGLLKNLKWREVR